MVKAVAGRPLALECVARGHPPPTLSWHHEGLPVAESNGTWLEAGGGVLSLESLGEASGGLYSCVASSPAGEAVLQYSVEVQGEPRPAPPESPGPWTPPPTPSVCRGNGSDQCPGLHETDKGTDEDTATWAGAPQGYRVGRVDSRDQGSLLLPMTLGQVIQGEGHRSAFQEMLPVNGMDIYTLRPKAGWWALVPGMGGWTLRLLLPFHRHFTAINSG